MARPKKNIDDNKTETLTIRLTPAEKQRFADIARTLESSMSQMIVTAVYRYGKDFEDKGVAMLTSFNMRDQLKKKRRARELEEERSLLDDAAFEE